MKTPGRLFAASRWGFVWFLSLSSAWATPSFQQVGSTLVMSNGNVRLEYNLNAGTTDFYWAN